MTNKKANELHSVLSAIKNLKGIKLNYAITRNVAKLRLEVDSFEKILEMTEDFKVFDEKRIELCKKHAKKDAKGLPVMTTKQIGAQVLQEYTLENVGAFEADLAELRKEHLSAAEARDKQIKEFEDFMKEESKVELFKVKLTDLPEDVTTEQMSHLLYLIED